MCTCLTLNDEKFLFGRTLDLEYNFGQKVAITPRNHPIYFKAQKTMENHYALIGMATIVDDQALFAEAVNEKGLGMAGLNFPNNACYKPRIEGKENVAPYEIIPWILGQCTSVDEAYPLLENINLLNEPFKPGINPAPLHWMLSDGNKSIVIEAMEDGVHIYDNPFHVLTNNPPFNYYLMHLNNYLHLDVNNPTNSFAKDVNLKAYGQGFGGIGLPGDYSPTSRFVKAAFLRANNWHQEDDDGKICQFFHILDNVSMVKGAVITPDGKPDYTIYTCCVDTQKGIYYYKTYDNNQIQAINMHDVDLDSKLIFSYELVNKQNYNK